MNGCGVNEMQKPKIGGLYPKMIKSDVNIESINEINKSDSIIFNSVSEKVDKNNSLWQHFSGFEIETDNDYFDDDFSTYVQLSKNWPHILNS